MSEPPPDSQTKIAAEPKSIEESSDPLQNHTEEDLSQSMVDFSAPSSQPISSPQNNQEPKTSAIYSKVIRNLSENIPIPKDPQDLSLKDYFPVYQNLFNTFQYFFGSFPPSSTEIRPENTASIQPKHHGRILLQTPSGDDIKKFLQIYTSSSGFGFFLLDVIQMSKESPEKQTEMLIQFFKDHSTEIPFILYIPFDQFLRNITNESY